jgi:hypothetical protein
MNDHPECKSNEVFVGNVLYEFTLENLKKNNIEYRKGKQAYTIDGKPLSESYQPLFISKKDFQKYDDMKMAELKEIQTLRIKNANKS